MPKNALYWEKVGKIAAALGIRLQTPVFPCLFLLYIVTTFHRRTVLALITFYCCQKTTKCAYFLRNFEIFVCWRRKCIIFPWAQGTL